MNISKKLLDMLEVVGEPKRALDVGCGEGFFVSYFSSKFSRSLAYGIDINRQSLANGIAKGNFDRAFPVHGDAVNIAEKNSRFSLVHLKQEYYLHGFVDWEKLEEKKQITLRNFDLVTAFNPYNKLSVSEINSLISGKEIGRKLVTVDIVSAAAKKRGYVIYQREIAHRLSGLYGGATPDSLTENYVEKNLELLLREGKKGKLEPVSNELINNGSTTELIVLFHKENM